VRLLFLTLLASGKHFKESLNKLNILKKEKMLNIFHSLLKLILINMELPYVHVMDNKLVLVILKPTFVCNLAQKLLLTVLLLKSLELKKFISILVESHLEFHSTKLF